jgi:PKD repeat protein
MKALKLFAVLASAFAIASCEPTVPGKTELGPLPTADYTMTYIDSNNVRLESQSTGEPFMYQWNVDGVGTFSGEVAEVFIPKMGVYNIEHNVFNQGGHATATGQVEIFKDADFVCAGSAEYLTDCTARTWKLAPQAGALWVGPLDGSQTWWAIGATAATDRPCAWNDEWTFNSDGEMIYDTKGDIWAETYMGVAADGCQPESVLTGDKAPWGSGTHQFEILPGAGLNGEDQIKVSGLGGFIGLPKAANTGEVSSPVSSITYTILSADDDGTTRTMEIEANCATLLWRFTLYSE